MTIKLMFKNLKNFITRSPLAFFVVVVIEVFGAVGLIVTYGIVRNVFTEQEKEAHNSKWMTYEMYDDGVGYTYWDDTEQVYINAIKLAEEDAKGLLVSVYLDGKITVDGEKYNAGCTKYYHEPSDSWWQKDWIDKFMRGENVVLLSLKDNTYSAGDMIRINGKDYEVLYAEDNQKFDTHLSNHFLFPYNCVPEGMEFSTIQLSFIDIPTHAQADAIAEKLKEYFGNEFPIRMPEIPDLLVQQFNTAMLGGCALAAVLIAFNCITVYMYIIRRRADWIAVVKLCGCKNQSIVTIMLSEILLVSCACFGIGVLISMKLLIPKLTNYYPLFDKFYTADSYRFLFLGLAGVFALVTLVQLTPFVRRTVDSMRKGGI